MQWRSAVSTARRLEDAVQEASMALTGLTSQPDLVLAFFSPEHLMDAVRLPELVADTLGHRALVVGCTAGGVIGDGKEVEGRVALSLTAAVLPNVEMVPLRFSELLGPQADAAAWQERVGLDPLQEPVFLLFPDPFSSDARQLVRGLDLGFPRAVKVGALASGGRSPGEHRLVLGRESHRHGAVGVALYGDIALDPIVAQGCRPVGPQFRVTRSEGPVVYELDGLPALPVVDRIYSMLPEGEREIFQRAPMVGLARPGAQGTVRHGDYLLRDMVRTDRSEGSFTVAGLVESGQVLRMHIRDPQSSREDLDGLLTQYVEGATSPAPEAALLFSCLGRGARFYGVADHDSERIKAHLGSLPVGGFFGNGEVGPVRQRTHLHGYTSSIALVRGRTYN